MRGATPRCHIPHTADYTDTYGGKNAHYMLRWKSVRREKDAWSGSGSAAFGA